MKNHTILSLSVALFLVACQPPEETSLEKLIEKKENFENSIDSINGLLIAINTKIGLLDTLKMTL